MAYKINDVTKKKIFEAVKKPHSIMLSGRKGSGMHATAIILAKAYLKAESLEDHPDFCEISQEEKEITKESVIELIDMALHAPMRAEKKVFIIDNAEMMNQAAQNTLLKTLESNDNSVFLLVAHKPLLPTIESRVEKIQFLPVTKGLDTGSVAYLASNGTPGAYFEIQEDEEFCELLQAIPAALTDRRELLRLMNCVKVSDKSFYETVPIKKVEFLMNFIAEGLMQIQMAQSQYFCVDVPYSEMMMLNVEQISYMLDVVRDNQKKLYSRLYTKHDFFEFLLNMTKEEVA